MTAEPRSIDPYDVVLADLRAKRDEIDRAIGMLESVRGAPSRPSLPVAPIEKEKPPPPQRLPFGEGEVSFAGLTIPEAAKKILTRERRHLTNPELAQGLQAGGLIMRSDDPANTIGSVLKRRQEDVGDLVRINPGRGGKWGLAEWAGVDPV